MDLVGIERLECLIAGLKDRHTLGGLLAQWRAYFTPCLEPWRMPIDVCNLG
jgi:hypothetical protein